MVGRPLLATRTPPTCYRGDARVTTCFSPLEDMRVYEALLLFCGVGNYFLLTSQIKVFSPTPSVRLLASSFKRRRKHPSTARELARGEHWAALDTE